MRNLAWLLLVALLAPAHAQDGKPPPKAGKQTLPALAVIVHPKNPVTKVSFSELRAYLKMERQFWPNKKRCAIYLPPKRSGEYGILLKKIYRMSHKRLQKYWVRKLFSGEIPSKPSYVPSAKAAGSRVLGSEGAISIVPASAVPAKVRVLLIDGKKPGDKGYPLVGKPPSPRTGR